MKQIIFLLTMLAATVAGFTQPCYQAGQIEMIHDGDSLRIYYKNTPVFTCNTPPVSLDSSRVIWYVACNPFDHRQRAPVDTLGVHDTLTIAAEGWRAVWATWQPHFTALPMLNYLETSSNTVFFTGPGAPYAEMTVTPNPNDGHFALAIETNAGKQYIRIIGPWGMVYGGWLNGSTVKDFSLLPFNPNGLYTVIVDWHFLDTCAPVARTRTSFILQR